MMLEDVNYLEICFWRYPSAHAVGADLFSKWDMGVGSQKNTRPKTEQLKGM